MRCCKASPVRAHSWSRSASTKAHKVVEPNPIKHVLFSNFIVQ